MEIHLFVKDGCEFCRQSKRLLDSLGADHKIRNIDRESGSAADYDILSSGALVPLVAFWDSEEDPMGVEAETAEGAGRVEALIKRKLVKEGAGGQ